VASPPMRIELRHLAIEREDAQRDLHETLVALEDKLLPQRAVGRLFAHHNTNTGLVLLGVAAAGAAIGFSSGQGRSARTASLLSAALAGAVFYQLGRGRR